MAYNNDRGGWYSPAAPAEPAAPVYDPAQAARQRRRRRMKTATLSICAVLVAGAAVLAAVHAGLLDRLDRMGRTVTFPYGEGDYFDFGSGSDTEQYDDFREYFENYYTSSDEIAMPTAPTGTGMTLDLYASRGEELTLQEIYDKVSPAVVGITTYTDGMRYVWGTGVVFSPDGYIITNTHILQGCDNAMVTFTDGREFEAKLVGADAASDIAVIVIEGEDLPYARFGRSGNLQVGDQVAAIGNPVSPSYAGTMTNGIISAINRNILYQGHTMTLLQTNAALNEGNSGGPLIDTRGQIIGITNMKIMSSYMVTVEGIGFAIPSAVVKQIADQLMDKGYVPGEPTIGIVAGPVGREAMDLYDLPEGVYVTEVSEGSDALEKGLMEGDVITHVNGTAVSTVAEVNLIKEDMAVGDTLTLTVYREGESFEMEIALVDKGAIK